MKPFTPSLALITALLATPAWAINCAALNQRAQATAAHHRPVLDKIVTARKPHFHSAPHAACKSPTFIVRHDHVVVYQTYGGYDYAMYLDKNSDAHNGWLKSSSLKTTGTMGGAASTDDLQ